METSWMDVCSVHPGKMTMEIICFYEEKKREVLVTSHGSGMLRTSSLNKSLLIDLKTWMKMLQTIESNQGTD